MRAVLQRGAIALMTVGLFLANRGTNMSIRERQAKQAADASPPGD